MDTATYLCDGGERREIQVVADRYGAAVVQLVHLYWTVRVADSNGGEVVTRAGKM